MERNLKVYNFISIQVLFYDRSKMPELLNVVNQIESMGGNIADITVQVSESDDDNQQLMSDICEDMPSSLYGKYKN